MVTCVAVSPDGKTLCSAGHAPDIFVWNVATARRVAVWKEHTRDVRSLCFAADGKRLVSGSVDRTVKVWDVTRGKVKTTLQRHEAEVNCVAFSPDGKRIVSGGWDKTLRVWDAETGKSLAVARGHTEFVRDVHFFGKDRFVSSGKDGVIRVWDAATGECKRKLAGHSGLVRSLALSPDGKTLASVSRDGNLFLWNFPEGKVIAKVEEGTLGFQCVVFLDGGKRLATGGIDRMVRLWDVAGLLKTHKAE